MKPLPTNATVQRILSHYVEKGVFPLLVPERPWWWRSEDREGLGVLNRLDSRVPGIPRVIRSDGICIKMPVKDGPSFGYVFNERHAQNAQNLEHYESIRKASTTLDEAMADFDACFPLPRPVLRCGQVWLTVLPEMEQRFVAVTCITSVTATSSIPEFSWLIHDPFDGNNNFWGPA